MTVRVKHLDGKGGRDESGTELRRTFIKNLAVAAAGMATLAAAGPAEAHPAVPSGNGVPLPISELPWRRTIFCQFDGEEKYRGLFAALAACGRETDCEIILGADGDPDIFAYGCFIQILDRNSVGEEMWRDYAAAYKDAGDITPCFIIDDRTDLPLPSWKFARQIDMREPSAVTAIVGTIRQMKAEMNRRLPAYFVQAGQK